jgi:Putative peptidoglycan binding domain
VGVKGDTIDDCSDQPGVREDGSPFGERQVGGQGDGGPFLPFDNHLEHQLRVFCCFDWPTRSLNLGVVKYRPVQQLFLKQNGTKLLLERFLMKLTFLVLAMMTCASELMAQNHIARLEGIIQSGMQNNSVQPGAGLGVGPTNHIARLEGIIQSGMQPNSVQPGAGLGVGPTNHINRLEGIIQSGMQPNSVQPGAGLGYGTSSASYTGETIRQVQTALRQLGYYHGQIDGQFGPLSQSALQNYQLKTNQPATGLLDRQSLSQLGVSAK